MKRFSLHVIFTYIQSNMENMLQNPLSGKMFNKSLNNLDDLIKELVFNSSKVMEIGF